MKIIDLCNKYINGEKMPKLIEYKGARYVFQEYQYVGWSNLLKISFENLNDEIEIIKDEPEKIEKMGLFDLTIEKEKDKEFELGYSGVADTIDKIYTKMDEVIDKVNYLLEKSDKE